MEARTLSELICKTTKCLVYPSCKYKKTIRCQELYEYIDSKIEKLEVFRQMPYVESITSPENGTCLRIRRPTNMRTKITVPVHIYRTTLK